jgi:hypothetical protein
VTLGTLGLDLETALMDEVEGLEGVAGVEDARDVDLVRALADHLDVHIFLRERCEHAPGDSDHISHLLSYHRQDRHVAMHGHLKRGSERASNTHGAQGCKGQGIFRTPVSGFFGFDFGRREARGEGGKEEGVYARCRSSRDRARDGPAAFDRVCPRSPC